MSGFVVEHIGYPAFFVYTASLSLVGLLVLYFLTRRGLSRAGVPALQASADVSRS
jgi:hypothetical protein